MQTFLLQNKKKILILFFNEGEVLNVFFNIDKDLFFCKIHLIN